MIKINCDIGEREADNPVDIALMNHIDIANIACGGHAGTPETVSVFRELARQNTVDVSAHLSYPDPVNFGRVSMAIPAKDLAESLDRQYALMPDVPMVKFHGGLYNDSCRDDTLAEALALWLKKNGITCILAPRDSSMARAAQGRGIAVLAEAFAERRYQFWPDTNRLGLMSRSFDHASIHDCDEAVTHAMTMVREGFVNAMIAEHSGTFREKKLPIACDTLCIHSDSAISLDLAGRLARLNKNGWTGHD